MKIFKKAVTLMPIALLLFCLPAFSQEFSINGSVKSSKGEEINGATVVLMKQGDSAKVSTTVTAGRGGYRFDHISPGDYFLSISFQGFKLKQHLAVTIKYQDLIIPTVELEETTKDLSTVNVSVSRPVYKKLADRLVVNVANTAMAAGGTALEVVERAPSVIIDRQNSSILVGGKSGVSVMINGKVVKIPQEALLKMLETMSASQIDRVEFISNYAKEDAEGAGGMINIVLKKPSHEGTNGSYFLSSGIGWYEKLAAGLTINHLGKKINFFGDFSFSWNRTYSSFDNYRQILRGGNPIISSANESTRLAKNLGMTGNVGFDYQLNQNTIFGGSIYSFINRPKIGESGQTEITDAQQKGTFTKIEHSEVNRWTQLLTNFNVRHTFATKDRLSADVDFLFYANKNPHLYKFDSYQPREVVLRTNEISVAKKTPIRFFVGRIDFLKNLGKKVVVETGIKGTHSTLDNDVSVANLTDGQWVPNAGFSQITFMDENIGAGYANLNYNIDNLTQMNVGLRYEYTQTRLYEMDGLNLVDRNYGNLFPNFLLSRKVSEKLSVDLSYNRRITRPTYRFLAPYVHFVDESTFISGNLFLKPVLSDVIEIGTRLQNKYTLTLGYNYSKNAILAYQVRIDTVSNAQNISAENMKNSQLLSLSLTAPFKVGNWWDIQSNIAGTFAVNNLDYLSIPLRNERFYMNFNLTHTFTFSNSFSGEFSAIYQSRSPFGMGYLKGSGAFSAGLKKKLRDNQGILRLTISDIFWNSNFSIANNQPQFNFNQSFSALFSEPRVIKLTYTRDFGNTKVKKAEREVGSKDERFRAN